MSHSIIILGANGRFGRAASKAFIKAGWHVTLFVRNLPSTPPVRANTSTPPVKIIQADATDAASLIKACQGVNCIVNALNPPYEKWQENLPCLTENVIKAAQASKATVLIPANIYTYGDQMPPLLSNTTAQAATNPLGLLRIEMERAYKTASQEGMQTVLLRAGDFIEKKKTGNWFDSHIANHALKGRILYPGPLNKKHAWAYLPDMADAMVELAQKRAQLPHFCDIGFSGYSLTGAELVAEIEQATQKKQTVKNMPWFVIKAMALFSPKMKKVLEMRYLWHVPHSIDGKPLTSIIPNYTPTPITKALKEVFAIK